MELNNLIMSKLKHFMLSCSLFIFMCGLAACQSSTPEQQPESNEDEKTMVPYQDIPVADFKAKMQEEGIVILDVRTPEETAEGKIDGAMEIDFHGIDFVSEIEKLDRDKTYLVYCRSGNRSGKTCKMMSEKGFKKLFNLEGGYSAWSKEN